MLGYFVRSYPTPPIITAKRLLSAFPTRRRRLSSQRGWLTLLRLALGLRDGRWLAVARAGNALRQPGHQQWQNQRRIRQHRDGMLAGANRLPA
jgi:hypothetical protein